MRNIPNNGTQGKRYRHTKEGVLEILVIGFIAAVLIFLMMKIVFF